MTGSTPRTPAITWITRAIVCVGLGAVVSVVVAWVTSNFAPATVMFRTGGMTQTRWGSRWVVSIVKTRWKGFVYWENFSTRMAYSSGATAADIGIQETPENENARSLPAHWSAPELWNAKRGTWYVVEEAVGWPFFCLAGWQSAGSRGGLLDFGTYRVLYRPLPAGLVANTAVYAPVVALLWVCFVRARARRRRRRGFCYRCCYSTRGLNVDAATRQVVCPECGTRQREGYIRPRPISMRRRVITCSVIGCVGPLAVAWTWVNGKDLVCWVVPWAAGYRTYPLFAVERGREWWVVRHSHDWGAVTATWIRMRDQTEADEYLERDWLNYPGWSRKRLLLDLRWPDEPTRPGATRPSGIADDLTTAVVHKGWGFPFACVGIIAAPASTPMEEQRGVLVAASWVIPFRPLPIGLVLDALVYAGAAAGVMLAKAAWRRRRGVCVRCKWPLRGVAADPATGRVVCPECGQVQRTPRPAVTPTV